MKNEYLRHKAAYLVLIISLLILGGLFFSAWPNRILQRYLAGIIMMFYLMWGCITHVKTSYLNHRVVLEYLVVSLLAGGLLILITI